MANTIRRQQRTVGEAIGEVMDQKTEHTAIAADDLDTPVVTILLDRLENNITRVQGMVAAAGKPNRPHIKTHKIPAIGKMQIAAGATGLTCQKLGEAEVFIDAGVTDDMLITFNIVGSAKDRPADGSVGAHPAAGRRRRQRDGAARHLGCGARAAAATVPVLIECDGGFGRNGVQSPEMALDLARLAGKLPRPRASKG